MTYYNDNDRYTADRLVQLIRAAATPPGVAGRRDIRDVRADDVREHEQVHLFAGIGGSALTLDLAGRKPRRPVRTVPRAEAPPAEPSPGERASEHRHRGEEPWSASTDASGAAGAASECG